MANGVVVQVELPVQQYEQLTQMAQRRQQRITEVAELAMTEWLARQARLEQARTRMRELGQGLGEGKTRTAARNHDAILYRKERK